MTRLAISLTAVVLLVTAAVGAQGVLGTNWQINPGDVAWFANDNNCRDLAYNPGTDHVLVATRSGGTQIQILNAVDGTSAGSLDMTGVSGGTFPINHVEVADDNVIYGANLVAFGFPTSPLRIYRWASEAAAPTVAFSSTSELTARAGDSFAVVGSGASTVLYLGGSGNSNIEVFTTADGVNFAAGTDIVVGSDHARLGIDVLPGGNLAINDPASDATGEVTEITTAGAVVGNIPSSEIDTFAGPLGVSALAAGTMLAAQGGPTNNAGGTVADVTGGFPTAVAVVVAPATIDNGNANINGAGAAAFDTTREALLLLNTNNSIGSYGSAVPVELSVFSDR